jgi:hypothetical protein
MWPRPGIERPVRVRPGQLQADAGTRVIADSGFGVLTDFRCGEIPMSGSHPETTLIEAFVGSSAE